MAFQSLVETAVSRALRGSLPEEPKQEMRAPATRQEAAQFLGISLPTVDQLIRSKQLASFRIGKSVRINWSDLESFISSK